MAGTAQVGAIVPFGGSAERDAAIEAYGDTDVVPEEGLTCYKCGTFTSGDWYCMLAHIRTVAMRVATATTNAYDDIEMRDGYDHDDTAGAMIPAPLTTACSRRGAGPQERLPHHEPGEAQLRILHHGAGAVRLHQH